ncbi:MAG TPA: DUF3105 domain-containing protein [Kofleriaceae bacterium]|nr:DUF3105 domain-containing protein [Kofleriaceae bacterium]
MRRWCPLLLLAGCSDPATPPVMMMVGGCDGMVVEVANDSAVHVPVSSPIVWPSNPPTGGPHYPIWAGWDRQYAQLDRGYYVHNAEHGGIVLLYHCDPECPDVVAQLVADAQAMRADTSCTAPVTKRVVVTSDPLLPVGVQVAAVAWNFAYTASCYDPYVQTFAREHYAHSPENTCADGANLGGTLLNP